MCVFGVCVCCLCVPLRQGRKLWLHSGINFLDFYVVPSLPSYTIVPSYWFLRVGVSRLSWRGGAVGMPVSFSVCMVSSYTSVLKTCEADSYVT